MEDISEKILQIELREGDKRSVKSYVTRSRSFSPSEIEVLEKYIYKYAFFFKKEKIDYKKLFDSEKDIAIEIGFGMGDTTYDIAIKRPEFNYIGIDVFKLGFVKFLKKLGEGNIDNVKIIRFNAPDVLSYMIEDNSVSAFHIFFPDPWPKKRHNKRRLINSSFLTLLSDKLKTNGYIFIVTDCEEYANEILEKAKEVETLVNPFYSFSPPVVWRPKTKFEMKAIKTGSTVYEIWITKK